MDKHTTHWQWYKSFFNITVLRYLVTWFAIVPILIKLTGGLDSSLAVKNVAEFHFVSNIKLPFSLQMLWLSSVFFVIALFLYHAFCPGFIKTYSSYGDFLKHHHSPRWLMWEAKKVIKDKDQVGKLFDRLYEKGYVVGSEHEAKGVEVIVEKLQTKVYFKYRDANYEMGLPVIENGKQNLESTKIAESEIFWELFGRMSSSRKTVRIIIIILLVACGLLFAWTLLEHIIVGLKYIIS